MFGIKTQWLRRQWRVLSQWQHHAQTRLPVASKLHQLHTIHARNFAMPAAILSQMDLLGRRYDVLAHELSQYVAGGSLFCSLSLW